MKPPALAQKVVAAASAYPRSLAVSAGELRHVAYEYARRKGAYVIASPSQIAGPFERAGFDLMLADSGGGMSERQADRPSSTAGLDSYRMRIVATKR